VEERSGRYEYALRYTAWVESPLPTVRVRFVPPVGQLVLTNNSRAEVKTFQEVPYPEGGVELLGYERQVVWADTTIAPENSMVVRVMRNTVLIYSFN
jgi:hypothetical protein